MAKPFAKAFYKSSAWRHCRAEYINSVAGLCELCYAQGIIKKGDELHHKVKLTPENIDNPCITLNPDNLIYLCREHHQAMHEQDRHKNKKQKRYSIDKVTGKVTTLKQ